MVKQVIILGGHIQALGLLRQVKGLGLPAILFVEDVFNVTCFSNSVYKTVVFRSIDNLEAYFEPYRDTDTLLFPTSDQYVKYLSDNYDYLNQHFVVGVPTPEIVSLFVEKKNTYHFAESMGIPHPKSLYPESFQDIEAMADTISYPVVVKPSVMHDFHHIFGKKAFLCKDKKELIDRCTSIMLKIPISGILIQEFLSGGSESLYSYGVFAVDGEPKAWLVANRIRQNPIDFGNSTTFAVTCDIPEIELTARKILKDTCYTGLAEVEFMYDSKSNTYKFLEINARAWKWHSISMGLGFGFLSEVIHHLNGEKGDFVPGYKEMAWVERVTDIYVSVKCVLTGRMRLKRIIDSYCHKKQSAVWSWNDPMPAIMYIILLPILYIKRH